MKGQVNRVSRTSLLMSMGILFLCAGTLLAVVGALETRQGPRGAFLLLGYGAFGYTVFGVVTTLALRRSPSLTSLLAASWLGIPWITWIIGTVGLASVVVLITHALTYGSAPAP